ncbi:hypothetical protein GLS40_13000 [Pseudooceanicola sp. 216_PA32_1]|jgi:hypothetical protein|uniref:Uncharacterized protein n=1 Tax=Pseudooceanicola pacificus TaxID=2676438 RepID=A0A844WF65_9RHOB|nr:hypothetical protein [Pseudooceanicola pacificus]MWB78950.1 hypothetical protein [Pseudooceanicola pacificus]
MSAPDMSLQTQARKHGTPIWGIFVSALFGALAGALVAITAVSGGDAPQGADIRIDGRTGAAEPAM